MHCKLILLPNIPIFILNSFKIGNKTIPNLVFFEKIKYTNSDFKIKYRFSKNFNNFKDFRQNEEIITTESDQNKFIKYSEFIVFNEFIEFEKQIYKIITLDYNNIYSNNNLNNYFIQIKELKQMNINYDEFYVDKLDDKIKNLKKKITTEKQKFKKDYYTKRLNDLNSKKNLNNTELKYFNVLKSKNILDFCSFVDGNINILTNENNFYKNVNILLANKIESSRISQLNNIYSIKKLSKDYVVNVGFHTETTLKERWKNKYVGKVMNNNEQNILTILPRNLNDIDIKNHTNLKEVIKIDLNNIENKYSFEYNQSNLFILNTTKKIKNFILQIVQLQSYKLIKKKLFFDINSKITYKKNLQKLVKNDFNLFFDLIQNNTYFNYKNGEYDTKFKDLVDSEISSKNLHLFDWIKPIVIDKPIKYINLKDNSNLSTNSQREKFRGHFKVEGDTLKKIINWLYYKLIEKEKNTGINKLIASRKTAPFIGDLLFYNNDIFIWEEIYKNIHIDENHNQPDFKILIDKIKKMNHYDKRKYWEDKTNDKNNNFNQIYDKIKTVKNKVDLKKIIFKYLHFILEKNEEKHDFINNDIIYNSYISHILFLQSLLENYSKYISDNNLSGCIKFRNKISDLFLKDTNDSNLPDKYDNLSREINLLLQGQKYDVIKRNFPKNPEWFFNYKSYNKLKSFIDRPFVNYKADELIESNFVTTENLDNSTEFVNNKNLECISDQFVYRISNNKLENLKNYEIEDNLCKRFAEGRKYFYKNDLEINLEASEKYINKCKGHTSEQFEEKIILKNKKYISTFINGYLINNYSVFKPSIRKLILKGEKLNVIGFLLQKKNLNFSLNKICKKTLNNNNYDYLYDENNIENSKQNIYYNYIITSLVPKGYNLINIINNKNKKLNFNNIFIQPKSLEDKWDNIQNKDNSTLVLLENYREEYEKNTKDKDNILNLVDYILKNKILPSNNNIKKYLNLDYIKNINDVEKQLYYYFLNKINYKNLNIEKYIQNNINNIQYILKKNSYAYLEDFNEQILKEFLINFINNDLNFKNSVNKTNKHLLDTFFEKNNNKIRDDILFQILKKNIISDKFYNIFNEMYDIKLPNKMNKLNTYSLFELLDNYKDKIMNLDNKIFYKKLQQYIIIQNESNIFKQDSPNLNIDYETIESSLINRLKQQIDYIKFYETYAFAYHVKIIAKNDDIDNNNDEHLKKTLLESSKKLCCNKQNIEFFKKIGIWDEIEINKLLKNRKNVKQILENKIDYLSKKETETETETDIDKFLFKIIFYLSLIYYFIPIKDPRFLNILLNVIKNEDEIRENDLGMVINSSNTKSKLFKFEKGEWIKESATKYTKLNSLDIKDLLDKHKNDDEPPITLLLELRTFLKKNKESKIKTIIFESNCIKYDKEMKSLKSEIERYDLYNLSFYKDCLELKECQRRRPGYLFAKENLKKDDVVIKKDNLLLFSNKLNELILTKNNKFKNFISKFCILKEKNKKYKYYFDNHKIVESIRNKNTNLDIAGLESNDDFENFACCKHQLLLANNDWNIDKYIELNRNKIKDGFCIWCNCQIIFDREEVIDLGNITGEVIGDVQNGIKNITFDNEFKNNTFKFLRLVLSNLNLTLVNNYKNETIQNILNYDINDIIIDLYIQESNLYKETSAFYVKYTISILAKIYIILTLSSPQYKINSLLASRTQNISFNINNIWTDRKKLIGDDINLGFLFRLINKLDEEENKILKEYKIGIKKFKQKKNDNDEWNNTFNYTDGDNINTLLITNLEKEIDKYGGIRDDFKREKKDKRYYKLISLLKDINYDNLTFYKTRWTDFKPDMFKTQTTDIVSKFNKILDSFLETNKNDITKKLDFNIINDNIYNFNCCLQKIINLKNTDFPYFDYFGDIKNDLNIKIDKLYKIFEIKNINKKENTDFLKLLGAFKNIINNQNILTKKTFVKKNFDFRIKNSDLFKSLEDKNNIYQNVLDKRRSFLNDNFHDDTKEDGIEEETKTGAADTAVATAAAPPTTTAAVATAVAAAADTTKEDDTKEDDTEEDDTEEETTNISQDGKKIISFYEQKLKVLLKLYKNEKIEEMDTELKFENLDTDEDEKIFRIILIDKKIERKRKEFYLFIYNKLVFIINLIKNKGIIDIEDYKITKKSKMNFLDTKTENLEGSEILYNDSNKICFKRFNNNNEKNGSYVSHMFPRNISSWERTAYINKKVNSFKEFFKLDFYLNNRDGPDDEQEFELKILTQKESKTAEELKLELNKLFQVGDNKKFKDIFYKIVGNVKNFKPGGGRRAPDDFKFPSSSNTFGNISNSYLNSEVYTFLNKILLIKNKEINKIQNDYLTEKNVKRSLNFDSLSEEAKILYNAKRSLQLGKLGENINENQETKKSNDEDSEMGDYPVEDNFDKN